MAAWWICGKHCGVRGAHPVSGSVLALSARWLGVALEWAAEQEVLQLGSFKLVRVGAFKAAAALQAQRAAARIDPVCRDGAQITATAMAKSALWAEIALTIVLASHESRQTGALILVWMKVLWYPQRRGSTS